MINTHSVICIVIISYFFSMRSNLVSFLSKKCSLIQLIQSRERNEGKSSSDVVRFAEL